MSSLSNLFDSEYDGFKAIRFKGASECRNMETRLTLEGISFKTKIIKSKKRGLEYIVMLLEDA
jgi:hypothetical protein